MRASSAGSSASRCRRQRERSSWMIRVCNESRKACHSDRSGSRPARSGASLHFARSLSFLFTSHSHRTTCRSVPAAFLDSRCVRGLSPYRLPSSLTSPPRHPLLLRSQHDGTPAGKIEQVGGVRTCACIPALPLRRRARADPSPTLRADVTLPQGEFDKEKALLFLTECVQALPHSDSEERPW